jgi:membrane protein
MDAPAETPARVPPRGPAPRSRRRKRLLRGFLFTRGVVGKTLRDGYIHAGNIAYLSLVTLLPLIILITAVTALFGQTAAGQAAIATVIAALPPNVGELFEPIIAEVLSARVGNVLWAGGLVALWTVTTFIETVRDMIHRAFGVPLYRGFVQNRLRSMGGTLAAMLLVILGFLAQLVFVVVVKAVAQLFPYAADLSAWIDVSQLVPPLMVFLALWALFKLLAPHVHRRSIAWPGALVTSIGWVGAALLLGPILSAFGGMSLTYGALSGVMVALLFFYIVGFALVLGAELNAALAKPARHR